MQAMKVSTIFYHFFFISPGSDYECLVNLFLFRITVKYYNIYSHCYSNVVSADYHLNGVWYQVTVVVWQILLDFLIEILE